jgi:6-phosphogluconate dehydrogenase
MKMGVAGFDKAGTPIELVQAGLIDARNLERLAEALDPPRITMPYVPAGCLVDDLLDALAEVSSRGTSLRTPATPIGATPFAATRASHSFCRCRHSGGPDGALNGACFMVGGDQDPVSRIEPVLRPLAADGGYVHAGGPGAGHFVKLVHNGIEFGMLQAIAEGVDLLGRYQERLPSPMFSAVGSTARSFAPACSLSWSEHIARSAISRRSRLMSRTPAR